MFALCIDAVGQEQKDTFAFFKYLKKGVPSRSTERGRPQDLDVCSLLTMVCPTVGMEGTPASCGDYFVVLERIRLP